MELKEFQKEALKKVAEFSTLLHGELELYEEFRDFSIKRGKSAPPMAIGKPAWDKAVVDRVLPNGTPPWVEHSDGLHRDVPSICLKVPTGGGKTLIGAQALGQMLQKFHMRTTGLALWVVPSEAIFSQTLRAFKNPQHPYRIALEKAGNGRLRVLTKNDRFSLDDVVNGLVIIVVMLQSAVREEEDALRVFRDSGGFSSFFPKVDDMVASQQLSLDISNLDRIDVGKLGFPGITIRHSLANVLRIHRPIVIIDEGHRAYSDLARSSLLSLNPSYILELSATPNMTKAKSNILYNVSGVVIKKEGLIKLPINLTALVGETWKAAVDKTIKIREELENLSIKDERSTGRYIRPIALIRVEATGSRKGTNKRVHADDVKKYLLTKLRVPAEWIRIKTSKINELGDEDLLSRNSKVRIILTMDALREGWDCSFAYVLTVLNAKTGDTAITQMIGRVLRQPHALESISPSLNEAHVVCTTLDVKHAVTAVSKGLQEEGLADVSGFIKTNTGSAKIATNVVRSSVEKRKFLLPVVAIKIGNSWEKFDPEAHLKPLINWKSIKVPDLTSFTPDLYIQQAKIQLGISDFNGKTGITASNSSSQVKLSAFDDYGPVVEILRESIPNSWIAYDLFKSAEEALVKQGVSTSDLPCCRFQLATFLNQALSTVVDKLHEDCFRKLIVNKELKLFANEKEHLGFYMEDSLSANVPKGDQLVFRADGKSLEKNVYSDVFESQINPLETAVIRELDQMKSVLWWWRLPVGSEVELVGWRKQRIYPDIVSLATTGKNSRLLYVESKGAHLAGNPETIYKRTVLDLLQNTYEAEVLDTLSQPKSKKKSKPINNKTATATDCRAAVIDQITWQTDLAAMFL
jgi:type III restriction enzyme